MTRVNDGAITNIVFAPSGYSATYQNNAIPAGYYVLSVELKDQTIVMWKGIDTVRIVAGQTSNGSFPLTVNPGQIGDIQLIVNPRLLDPIAIYFDGQQDFLQQGTNMTVTATTNEDPVDAYQWYMNGTLLNYETGASITIGSSLPVGIYHLTLVVIKGDVAGNKTLTFQVESSGNISYHPNYYSSNKW
ncbi:MAG TPA: hypothetical protein VHY08_17140 [Bacillota bacterium]|nr:hypothetical protein [Bacillota bacterium]